MKILKFGGTSVGSAERMRSIMKLITDKEPKIVVLSAMAGTTNKLAEISDFLHKKNYDTANELISKLEDVYSAVINELYKKEEFKTHAKKIITGIFNLMKAQVGIDFTDKNERIILAQGEIMSTNLFVLMLKEEGIKVELLPALEYMRTNQHSEPDYPYIKTMLEKLLSVHKDKSLFVTQGYICMNTANEIDNLKRGGSDYSASIIGAAVNASEIQIWTDIDGMHNNDPRFVEKTHSIKYLSFEEASELAYFGAKILHPSSIIPAMMSNIPVVLKNTMDPTAKGTTINKDPDKKGIKAIAAKDGITMIKIKSTRMLLAYGFLKKVFEIFERFKTPIDMITTSEVGVSVTIDNTQHLNDISEELKKFCSIEIATDQTIICMVGYAILENGDISQKIFTALKGIPLQMISYGGSTHNISVLIDTPRKKEALVALNHHIFF